MRKAVVAAVLVITTVPLISACDDRPCLQSHTVLIPVWTGKAMALIPEPVCDKYAPKNRVSS